MCCVPALFVVKGAVHKRFTKIFRANGERVPSCLLRGLRNKSSRCLPIEGQIENWMTVRMRYDLAKTSLIESEQSDAAVRFRGRDRKTTFGENGKQSANFSRNSSVLHPCFLLFVRKSFNGQDRNFSQISSCGSAKRSSASSAAFPLENP